MKNKQAQIGVTLTWIPAVIIVFFLMLIFVALTIGLSSKKQIDNSIIDVKTFVSSENGEKSYDLYQENYLMLNTFLNSQVEKDGKIYRILDLIYEDLEGNFPFLKLKFDSYMKDYNPVPDCYQLSLGKFDIGYFSNLGRGMYRLEVINRIMNKNAVVLNSKDNLEIKFYAGGCK